MFERKEPIELTNNRDEIYEFVLKQDYLCEFLDWDYLVNFVTNGNLLSLWLSFLET